MKSKKIVGYVLLSLGVGLVVFSSVISGKVNQGEQKIQKAQKGVNTARKISRINPYARQITKEVTKPAQRKINKGKKEVKKYRGISLVFLIGGIVLAVGGTLVLFFGYRKKKK